MHTENTSDAWHIPRYPTRKHCITSIYPCQEKYSQSEARISVAYSAVSRHYLRATVYWGPFEDFSKAGVHYWECVSYARLRIRVVSQPFCVDQLNPAGFNVPNDLIRKTPALFLRGELENGGGGFVPDDIYFQVSH